MGMEMPGKNNKSNRLKNNNLKITYLTKKWNLN